MPSVRFARDKRGYEYVYLVHAPTRKGKPGKSRVLYWYRTPPGVRIGRKPFDEEVRRTLEAQNPGLTFDWEAIVATPMPPPDMTEYWRERRRLEKAAKLERLAEEALEAAASSPAETQVPESQSDDEEEAGSETSGEEAAVIAQASGDMTLSEVPDNEQVSPADAEEEESEDAEPGESGASGPESGEPRRKRRRRGGRRRRGAQRTGQSEPGQPGPVASLDDSVGQGAPSESPSEARAPEPSSQTSAPDSQIAVSAEPQTSASEE